MEELNLNIGALELINGAIGAALPVLVRVFEKHSFSDRTRVAISLVFCVLAGLLTSFFSGELSATDIGVNIGIVTIFAQSFYRNVWKPAVFDNKPGTTVPTATDNVATI
jgi:Na+/H+ antiporter NhaB